MTPDSPAPIRLGVVADTHGRLPTLIHDVFRGVYAIFHAGDVEDNRIIEELRLIAPVRLVPGNCDFESEILSQPEVLTEEFPFGTVGMTHGHLAPRSNDWVLSLPEMFTPPLPRIIIYGHSHIARIERIHHTTLLNPGSAGQPRGGRPASVAIITATPQHSPTWSIAIQHISLTPQGAAIMRL
jgi:putative phosphoesterase